MSTIPSLATSVPRTPEQLQRALDFTALRTRELYDHSPLLYFVLDGAGVVIDCNRRALTALGRAPAELIGAPLSDLVEAESREGLARRLERLAGPEGPPEEPLDLQLQAPGRPGPLFTSATLSAVRAADGAPVEVHVMMLDTSEMRRLQQRMVQADRLASVGQLAAGVAHEINNPAAFVIANLSFIRDQAPMLERLLHQPPGGREIYDFLAELPQLCEQTLHGMRRIRDIVRDLQVFSRATEGKPEQIDLNGLCDTVANMAWVEIRRHARLEKCYGDVPALCGYPGRLSQVLMNLVINAAHAIPEGNQARNKITITTAVVPGGEWVTVAVRDTGSGIPHSVLGRIFEPFFTTKPPGKGTGLGLAVSQEIIQNHGGHIEVKSEVGAGTTFTVWLPVLRPGALSPPPAPPRVVPGAGVPATAEGAGKEAKATPRGRVLVVDDEPELLRAIARTLGPDHDVVLAGTGEEARAILQARSDFDVILCDVMMPETSGMDLYDMLPRPLRERFLFMSGDTASLAARAFLDSVRRPSLDKPVEPEQLRRAVAEAVSRRRG